MCVCVCVVVAVVVVYIPFYRVTPADEPEETLLQCQKRPADEPEEANFKGCHPWLTRLDYKAEIPLIFLFFLLQSRDSTEYVYMYIYIYIVS